MREVHWLAASAGIAPVLFAAKIATDVAKPDGQIEVLSEDLTAFLDPLPIGRLFGVGPKTEASLKTAGVRTIGDLRRADSEQLRWRIGGDPEHLQALARGEDAREIESDREAKSIGSEETFDRDLVDIETIETYLLGQAERVAARLATEQPCRAWGDAQVQVERLQARLTTADSWRPPTTVPYPAYRRARTLE